MLHWRNLQTMALNSILRYFGYALIVSILGISATRAMRTRTIEYCMDDTVNAQCDGNEVILVTRALYGRMTIGKCVKEDMGLLGCSVDVSLNLHQMCSGKGKCEFPVMDLYDRKPCKELNAYLELTYTCQQVLTAPKSQCQSSQSVLVSGSHGYISSYVARESGCGDMAHPWRIEVLPGQRVNITLTSYHATEARSPRKCTSLGYITEVGHRNNVTICAKSGNNKHVYTSNGRNVQIYIDTRGTASEEDFILHYEIFGCPDLKVGAFSWYKREGNDATVGCEGQDMRWELKCHGNQWRGVIGNCSENVGASVQRESGWSMEKIDLQTLTIACIGLGFAVIIIIAGTVIAWKCKENSRHKPPSTVLLQEEQYRINKGPLPPVPQDSSHYRSLIRQPGPQAYPQPHSQTMPRNQPQYAPGEEDYSTDWKFGTAPWNKQNT